MLLIQPLFLATWHQVDTKFFPEGVWTNAVFQAHITYPPDHNTIITSQFQQFVDT